MKLSKKLLITVVMAAMAIVAIIQAARPWPAGEKPLGLPMSLLMGWGTLMVGILLGGLSRRPAGKWLSAGVAIYFLSPAIASSIAGYGHRAMAFGIFLAGFLCGWPIGAWLRNHGKPGTYLRVATGMMLPIIFALAGFLIHAYKLNAGQGVLFVLAFLAWTACGLTEFLVIAAKGRPAYQVLLALPLLAAFLAMGSGIFSIKQGSTPSLPLLAGLGMGLAMAYMGGASAGLIFGTKFEPDKPETAKEGGSP